MYNVVEKFVSINGESKFAGQLAVFIRFRGCNLNCVYCDTKWANTADAPAEQMTKEEIYDYIKSTGVRNVTLTGGEPLLQKGIQELLEYLAKDKDLRIEIETNGSVDIKNVKAIENCPSVTLDYKTPYSGMEKFMLTDNYKYLDENDTIKFVCGSIEDLEKTKYLIDTYNLKNRCHLYISPVFGTIELPKIVDFMIENNMTDVNMQLQLHKYIWSPDKKGV